MHLPHFGTDLTTSIRILRRRLDALDVQNLGQCGFKKKCCRHRRCLQSRTSRWSKFSQLAILKTGEKQQEFCWQQKNNLITWSNSTVKLHPRNLTWNLKIMVSKWTFLFQGLIFRFHVKFRGRTSMSSVMPCWIWFPCLATEESFRNSIYHQPGAKSHRSQDMNTWIKGHLIKIIMTAYKLGGSNYVFYMPSCHPTT